MPSPFPGMDPWLEAPAVWTDLHTRLSVHLSEALTPRVGPRYYVAVEQRTYLGQPDELVFVGRPDVAVVGAQEPSSKERRAPATAEAPQTVTLPVPDEVRESYLEVRDAASGEVVTVLEFLSPGNKVPGTGRREYEEKRLRILGTRTSLVEVDLLRIGRRLAMSPEATAGRYSILVARGWHRPRAEVYEFGLRDPIRTFPLPLRAKEAEPMVDLKPVLDEVYDRAGYPLRLRYDAAPDPPLSAADVPWARERISGHSP